MEHQVFDTHSAAETERLGERLAKALSGGEVVALFGGLGMGKTAFVRGMCRGLGYEGEVSSPTFAIVHEYIGGRLALYHFDMYRVEGYDSLASCGYFDYLDLGGVLAVEWSENIEGILPPDMVRVTMQPGPEQEYRVISLCGICLPPEEQRKEAEPV